MRGSVCSIFLDNIIMTKSSHLADKALHYEIKDGDGSCRPPTGNYLTQYGHY